MFCIFILRFCEIRYEACTRIADHFRTDEFYSERCEIELNSLYTNIMLYTVCTLKPYDNFKVCEKPHFNAVCTIEVLHI
jgi:hypothetical protein